MARNNYTKVQLIELMEKAFICMSDDYQETKTKMQGAGFCQLGSGNYGSAWNHPSVDGWCIKICGRVDGDSYPAYVYWAMANPMPGVPEFKFATFSQQHDVFMVMLPQYQPFECKAFCGGVPTHHDEDFFSAKACCHGHASTYDGKTPNHSPVAEAARLACDFFSDHVQWDLHDGNFMIDPETDLLIMTDPIHQGHNNFLISRVSGRDPVVQSWGRQLKLDIGGVPRNEFMNLPPLPVGMRNLKDHGVLEGFNMDVMHMDFADAEFRMGQHFGAKMIGFGNPQQIPRLHELNRMLPSGAHVRRSKDMMRRVYRERIIGEHGTLLAKNYFAFEDVRAERAIDPINRAAKWVKDNGVNPRQVRQIAEVAQDWPDERLAGQQYVMMAHCKTIVPVPCNPADIEAMANQPVAVQNWRIPVRVLRILRDMNKIQQNNEARLGWGGRFAAAAKRELGRFI